MDRPEGVSKAVVGRRARHVTDSQWISKTPSAVTVWAVSVLGCEFETRTTCKFEVTGSKSNTKP